MPVGETGVSVSVPFAIRIECGYVCETLSVSSALATVLGFKEYKGRFVFGGEDGPWTIFSRACLRNLFFNIAVRGETAQGGLEGLIELMDGECAVYEVGLGAQALPSKEEFGESLVLVWVGLYLSYVRGLH